MAARKQHEERNKKMYVLYCDGRNVKQVAELFSVSSTAVSLIFKRNNWPTRTTGKPKIEFNGSRYSIDTNGYFRSTTCNSSKLHRDVWIYHYGKIPDKLIVAFINGNKVDCRIENLELISRRELVLRNNKKKSELVGINTTGKNSK